MIRKFVLSVIMGLVLSLGAATAWAQVSLPNTFSAGQPARADEVNANFQTLADAFNANLVRQMVVISAVADDDTANGQALLDAVAAITDASESRPYLIRLGPGIFDLGTNTLTMREYVNIAGSGQGIVDATSSGVAPQGGSRIVSTATTTVAGARYTELTNLSVVSTGGTGLTYTNVQPSGCGFGVPGAIVRAVTVYASDAFSAVGIHNDNSCPLFKDVTVFVTTSGTAIGVEAVNGSSPVLSGVTVRATGGSGVAGAFAVGVSVNSSGLVVEGSTIFASATNNITIASPAAGFGIANGGSGTLGSVIIQRSSITGNAKSIVQTAAYATKIAVSQMSGTIDSGGNFSGNIFCYAVYDAFYTNAFAVTVCP